MRQINFIQRALSCVKNDDFACLMRHYSHSKELKIFQDMFGAQICWSSTKIKSHLHASFTSLFP
jgi:hypothetical protein